jgi:hypothetical protein
MGRVLHLHFSPSPFNKRFNNNFESYNGTVFPLWYVNLSQATVCVDQLDRGSGLWNKPGTMLVMFWGRGVDLAVLYIIPVRFAIGIPMPYLSAVETLPPML